ncbi:MAG: hypothetical protein QHH27_09075 [Clostridia bacterium]|jgi:uncharacterized membrane protein|nr:hypothetical protein [Clostridia bacterium]MDH7573684.1 hypothetical protein [Clostridia bacterium]
MWLLLLAAYAALVALEVPGLVKRGMRRELAAFFFFLALAVALTLPQSLGVELPNPMRFIGAIFRPLSKWLE